MKIIKYDPKQVKEMFLISPETDPLTAFYEWVVLEADAVDLVLLGMRPQVSRIKINREFYEKEVRGKILQKYAKKKMKYASEQRIQSSIALYDLDLGPATGDDVPVGEIHLEQCWLEE
jgi:hypothetical protein